MLELPFVFAASLTLASQTGANLLTGPYNKRGGKKLKPGSVQFCGPIQFSRARQDTFVSTRESCRARDRRDLGGAHRGALLFRSPRT